MKINADLLIEIEKYTSELIIKKTSENLTYHTIEHTQNVVKNAKLIGQAENFSKDEINILIASAWFHDIGYIKTYQGHEAESAKIAVEFLTKRNIDIITCNLVSESIMATVFPHQPTHKISEALCDADFMHIGTKEYFDIAEKLRRELKNAGISKLSKSGFEKDSVQLFNNHTFFTNYCKGEITNIKKKNLKIMQKSISKKLKKKKEKTEKAKNYPRGVDSMFKLTARNQINLSSIADNKSNILISLNGIIISLGLVALASMFKEEPDLLYPTVVFIIFSMTTIILAILSTRPNISTGKFSKEDIKQKKVNMLFFGNFHNMKVEDYEWAIKEMINDDKYLYSSMTKDQYYLGKVLAKKYKLLRWAYNIFMVGIIVSVIAFLRVYMQIQWFF